MLIYLFMFMYCTHVYVCITVSYICMGRDDMPYYPLLRTRTVCHQNHHEIAIAIPTIITIGITITPPLRRDHGHHDHHRHPHHPSP